MVNKVRDLVYITLQIIKYLLSLSEMSATINALNRAGLTPLDMLDRSQRDSISLTIEHTLTEQEAQRSTNTNNTVITQQPVLMPLSQSQSNVDSPQPSSVPTPNERSKWNKQEKFCKTYLINQGNWIDKKNERTIDGGGNCDCNNDFSISDKPTGWCLASGYKRR